MRECNWEGLILIPYWICFCDFNSYFATFVIIGIYNGLLTWVAQKFTFGGLGLQKIVAYLFIGMTGDIPFHTTCEMTVRK